MGKPLGRRDHSGLSQAPPILRSHPSPGFPESPTSDPLTQEEVVDLVEHISLSFGGGHGETVGQRPLV